MTTFKATTSESTPSSKMTPEQYLAASLLLRVELDRVRGLLDAYAQRPIDAIAPEPHLLQETRREWVNVLQRYADLDTAYFDGSA